MPVTATLAVFGIYLAVTAVCEASGLWDPAGHHLTNVAIHVASWWYW